MKKKQLSVLKTICWVFEGNSTHVSSPGDFYQIMELKRWIIRTKEIPSTFGNGNIIQKSTLLKWKYLLRDFGSPSFKNSSLRE